MSATPPDGAPRPTAKTYPRPKAVPVQTKVPFSFVHINKCGGSSIEIALGIAKRHAPARVMREQIGRDAWAKRYTFAVVRNPFQRAVSIYFYRVRTDQGGLGDRHLNVNQWIERVWGARDPAYTGEAILIEPAWDWVSDKGVRIVDEIARLETIDRDWPRIADRLGVAPTLARTNWNAHPTYRDLLLPGARRVIEEAFAADFREFGYHW